MFINPETISNYDRHHEFFDVGDGLFIRMTEKERKLRKKGRIIDCGVMDEFTAAEYDNLVRKGEKVNRRSLARLRRMLILRMRKDPLRTDYFFSDGKARSPEELKELLRKRCPSVLDRLRGLRG